MNLLKKLALQILTTILNHLGETQEKTVRVKPSKLDLDMTRAQRVLEAQARDAQVRQLKSHDSNLKISYFSSFSELQRTVSFI